MARRPKVSQQKRQREQRKAEKAERKRSERFARSGAGPTEGEAADADTAETTSVSRAEIAPEPPVPGQDEEVAAPVRPLDTVATSAASTECNPSSEVDTMSEGDPPVDRTKAYCKRCSAMAEHLVLEKRGNRIRRVRCVTCDETHAYLSKRPASKKKAGGTGLKQEALSAASYETLTTGRDLKSAAPYRMTARFSGNELVAHGTFGTGVVTQVFLDDKVEIAFPEGKRTLVHNR
jgi:hypothetical protein